MLTSILYRCSFTCDLQVPIYLAAFMSDNGGNAKQRARILNFTSSHLHESSQKKKKKKKKRERERERDRERERKRTKRVGDGEVVGTIKWKHLLKHVSRDCCVEGLVRATRSEGIDNQLIEF